MTRRSFQLELDLTRTDGDRRLYLLEGIGTIRLQGLLMRAATAKSADAASTTAGVAATVTTTPSAG